MIQLFSKSGTLERRLKSIGIDVQYVTDISTLDEDELIITESTLVEELVSFNRNFTIFALTPAPSFQEGTQLLTLGIKGYGNAYMHAKHLRRAIITIKEGNIWLYPAFMQELISSVTPNITKQEPSKLDTLTTRQKETALLIKEGKSNKEIAQALGITERTVKAHISAIFEKTGATDRLTLALLI